MFIHIRILILLGLYIKHYHGKKLSVVKVQEGANISSWAFRFCFLWLCLWLSFAEICRMNISVAWLGRKAETEACALCVKQAATTLEATDPLVFI